MRRKTVIRLVSIAVAALFALPAMMMQGCREYEQTSSQVHVIHRTELI